MAKAKKTKPATRKITSDRARGAKERDEARVTKHGAKFIRREPRLVAAPRSDEPTVNPRDNVSPGTPVFVAWPGAEPPHNRKRGVLLRYNKNGKPVVAIARVDAKGNYTGDVPETSERVFEPHEVWPIESVSVLVPSRDAKLLTELSDMIANPPASVQAVTDELAKTESTAARCNCNGVDHATGTPGCAWAPVDTAAIVSSDAPEAEEAAPWE